MYDVLYLRANLRCSGGDVLSYEWVDNEMAISKSYRLLGPLPKDKTVGTSLSAPKAGERCIASESDVDNC